MNVISFYFCRTINQSKRVDFLIKSIAALKYKDYEFWIVGGGQRKNV